MFPGHLAPTVPFAARTARHVPLALQLQQPRRVKGAGRWLCSCGRCACFGAVQQHTTAAASVALQRRRLASGRQAGQLAKAVHQQRAVPWTEGRCSPAAEQQQALIHGAQGVAAGLNGQPHAAAGRLRRLRSPGHGPASCSFGSLGVHALSAAKAKGLRRIRIVAVAGRGGGCSSVAGGVGGRALGRLFRLPGGSRSGLARRDGGTHALQKLLHRDIAGCRPAAQSQRRAGSAGKSAAPLPRDHGARTQGRRRHHMGAQVQVQQRSGAAAFQSVLQGDVCALEVEEVQLPQRLCQYIFQLQPR